MSLLTAAREWRKANPPKRPLHHVAGKYAKHLADARVLFAKEKWPILDIARFLRQQDPDLQKVTLSAVNNALARALKPKAKTKAKV